jgi:Na+/H+-dicarboxylate symporter
MLYITYLTGLYCIVAKFNLKQAYIYFRNTLPSGIMGFTTMSSIITMPITLRAAEKNTQNPAVAETVIPFTVNIHMIGDSLAIPIMAMAILFSFGHPLPAFEQYLFFACYFVLCRLAVAAVPGGGILVVLPILESYLGFSPEMSALITTLFVLFDPFATAVNVIGNGGFAILVSQFFKESLVTLPLKNSYK